MKRQANADLIILQALFADRSPIPETSGNVYKVSTSSELDALLSSTVYVVVDFYADWCPPCRAIAPVFSKLADENAVKGKLAFAKVNVDHVKTVASRYSVTAMPTFVFFTDGKPTPVAVQGLKANSSLSMTDDGLLERIRGANVMALKGAVQALADTVKAEPSK